MVFLLVLVGRDEVLAEGEAGRQDPFGDGWAMDATGCGDWDV